MYTPLASARGIAFRASAIFIKAVLNTSLLMKQSQRKHLEQAFQSHLGTSRQEEVPAWTPESIPAFHIPHQAFRRLSQSPVRTRVGLRLTSGGKSLRTDTKQPRRFAAGSVPIQGMPVGRRGTPAEKAALPPTRRWDMEHDSEFLDMCCLAPKQRDFCSF